MKGSRTVFSLIQILGYNLQERTDREMAGFRLTSRQSSFLTYLHNRAGEKVSQKDMQKFFRISHPTTRSILQKLAAKGLIRVLTDPRDKRRRQVELTERETILFRGFQDFSGRMDTTLLEGIREEEALFLRTILEKLLLNLERKG